MRRLPPLSTPRSIAIADEPLADRPERFAAATSGSTDGFEIVPAWQARPPRRLRLLSRVGGPVMLVAAAAALSAGRNHDAPALRESPGAAGAASPARAPALVVSGGPAARRDSRSPAR